LAFETNWHTIFHDETRMSGRWQMTNNKALALALGMAGLAAASYRFGYKGKGVAIVAIMAACVFAVWPIRLKSGLAGKEQWREIRPKGRTHFVITYGVAFCGVFAVWIMAPSYVAYSHLPKYWAWQLFSLLCAGCLGGLWEWRARERKYSE
jgi:drug/metabolite transporter (DMT)-like permease